MFVEALSLPRLDIGLPRFPRWGVCAGFITAAALGVFILPLSVGATIEGYLFPSITHHNIPISSVSRVGQWVCWTWAADVERTAAVLKYNAVLDTPDGVQYPAEIISAQTAMLWHPEGALVPGHYKNDFCASIPASVGSTSTIRLHQAITYQGVLALWTVRTFLPDIVAE